MIEVAVVGCGHMGRLHARTVDRHPACRLVAVVDPEGRCAAQLSSLYGAELRPDVPDVQVVVVATPTSSHRAVAEPLLGRWLLVEKALAATAVDAEALVHPRVVVAHSERFNPVIRRLGVVAPVHLQARRLAPPSGRCQDVSAVLDLMVHDLDLLLAWTGQDIEHLQVSGHLERCTARLRLSSGSTALLEASRLAERPVRTLRVQERASFLQADLARARIWVRGHELLPATPEDPLTAQWAAFVRAVRGEAPPAVSAAHAARVVRAACAIEAGL